MAIDFIGILKVIFLGIVEGITEWLPISSTGHMLLVDEFITLPMSESFKEMFFYVIQLGAIIAVPVIFWNKMFPFNLTDKTKPVIKKDIFSMWFKILFAIIPSAILGILFDDIVEEHFGTPLTISLMLIIYGIAFIIIEKINKNKRAKISDISEFTYSLAFVVGLFQVLSMIPGTSRSGATIIGALIFGASRTVAAEFTFFLALPTMIGASLIKLLKFGFVFTITEIFVLLLGMAVAFIVSVIAIRFLMDYVKKHDFKLFGIYRIILGALIILITVIF